MKLKAIICLFLISLLSCFILGSCDKNHDEDKEVFSLEEWKSYYGLLNQKKSLTFDNFEHLQKSFQKTPQEDATYYYVINTEVYSNNNLRGSYEYSYDLKEFTTVDNEEIFVISVSDINISSAGMPKKVDCGPIKIGGGPRTIYYYTAYPTNNTQTPITIKHSLLADSPTRLMLFYQNDKLIGKMQYLPALADDEYYEEFFKNCLCVISGSPSLVKNKDTIDYQEEIKEFSAADSLILISDFNEFFGGLFQIDEILKDLQLIVKEKNIDFGWYFVGDGPERTKLENKITEYGLMNNIIITGMQENPYSYIGACDIYVQPSYEESFGLTIKEAQILCRQHLQYILHLQRRNDGGF